MSDAAQEPDLLRLEETGREDVGRVGGKNASLGEMIRELGGAGIRVPGGFATTAGAWRRYLDHNGLEEEIAAALEAMQGGASLKETGARIRGAILEGDWPDATARAIREAYGELAESAGEEAPPVAVRSSATAEDLPDASFAGQQETYLNIRGAEAVLDACRRCYASLYTDRAISYREAKGFRHLDVALSAGVQRMVRADAGASGVMFSIDPETGFPRAVRIDGAWGLGEMVVQGEVDPDSWEVFRPLLEDESLVPIIEARRGSKLRKMVLGEGPETPTRVADTDEQERGRFCLSEAEALQLARWAGAVEAHYGCAMDMEWGKDGVTGELFILQARPETVQSQRKGALRRWKVSGQGARLVSGLAIGEAAASGPVRVIESAAEIERFEDGAVLVTGATDPDWAPIMKRAAAIVTDHGGRTSHAAIVSRELGLPAVVGTGDATRALEDGREVTVSCAEGATGHVHDGRAEIETEELDLSDLPETRTKVMLNLANPAAALSHWRLPADGVGLARMEFVINEHIRAHPLGLLRFDEVEDAEARERIAGLTQGWENKAEFFVERLARGLGRIAAAHHPGPVIVRMSDFKSNEYAHLIGGAQFEPQEENPMLGLRGASRYYAEGYRDAFALECRAIRKLREEMGFSNVVVMIPFCRTPGEADRVLEVMAETGLSRGVRGLEVYVMCEIPSNVVLAREFAARFDGFSIGSNDLTQLTLGVDRDSEALSHLFSEDDPAVRWMISRVIGEAQAGGARVGLCGQAPSDRPDFAAWLVEQGIDSVSVGPDSFVAVKRTVAEAERRMGIAPG